MAPLSRTRRHSPPESTVAAAQAQGARGVQTRVYAELPHAMVARYQVGCRLPHAMEGTFDHLSRFYWFRLLIVSLIWFIYDFSSYSFGIYSSQWLTTILGDTYPLWVSFGWNTVINLFYIPGAILGAFVSDWIGPRLCLAIFVLAQGLVGFLMTGIYPILNQPKNVGGFVVLYG